MIDLLLNKNYKKRPDIKDLYNKIKILIKILKNEIKMVIEINDDDINKDIYFLDNRIILENYPIKYCHDGLQELNEENVELYIDEKKYNYKKYHKFTKGKHTIVLKLKIKIKDCSKMFSNCINLTNIDLSNFNTSKATDMTAMFYNCRNLTNIDLSSFNTSNVTNMTAMFSDCINLTNLDLSSFNTSNVTNMTQMLSNCYIVKH